MATDVLQAILTDVAGQISGLSLGPTVVIRKGPKKEPTVDAAQQITVSMDAAAEKVRYIAFGHLEKTWPIEITYIAPSKRDYVTGFANDTAFRQAIEGIYNPPLTMSALFPTTPGAYDARLKPKEMLPRGEIAEGIDRFTVILEVKTVV